jgi:hypothetical protein
MVATRITVIQLQWFLRFKITLPKEKFTDFFFTETPFDQTPFDRMPLTRKFNRPNRRLTERRLTESSFYRTRKWSFDRIYFQKKMSFDQKKLRTRSFDR